MSNRRIDADEVAPRDFAAGEERLAVVEKNTRASPTSDAGGLLTFPEKLMSLLNDGSVDDAMWWLPDGDAFCIQPQRFLATVLEPHFRCKYESFTRKLNRCKSPPLRKSVSF